MQVEVAEQQRLLVRELRRAPVLEKKPLDVLSTAEGKGVREKRGSNSAYFKWPTDPLWSRQWSLVINSLIARDDVYYTHNSLSTMWVRVGASLDWI